MIHKNWLHSFKFIRWLRAAVAIFLLSCSGRADEGMVPISELKQLDLAEKGIHLSADEVFNPDKICLVDGICRVNGCTGSFISLDGLIITNHHCAYEAIQQVSLQGTDRLAEGFQATAKSDEIPSAGYVVRITEGYTDVSSQVLSVVQSSMDFLTRTEAIRRQSRQLEKDAEEKNPGLRAEVAEMFTGKSYMLFLYTYLRDVRLVFAPPSAIGNFGGETDNWEWPRHTGDFALMRAYTAPDGSSATYDSSNIPYRPKRVIRVNPQGVNEGDAVFLLGYPGRTARHKTASFIEYEQEARLPLTVALYSWQIAEMTQAGATDRSVELKMLSRLKSLANVEKRSRGQLQGLVRTNILKTRQQEESQLEAYIEANPMRQKTYGNILKKLDKIHQQMRQQAALELYLEQLRTAPRLLAAAWFLVDWATERAKPDVERELPYLEKNFEQTKQLVANSLNDFHAPTEKKLLAGLFERLKAVLQAQDPTASATVYGLDQSMLESAMIDPSVDNSQLSQPGFLDRCLQLDANQLALHKDPIIRWMQRFYPTFLSVRQANKTREGELNELYGLLLDIKQQYLKTKFIPDANGTLRLTSGRVRAYSPVDGIIKTPISTFRGVVEKTTGAEPFITPKIVMEAWTAKRFGDYQHPDLNEIPVAILYDADTTGGNSGSPVLNSRGELVGVNFDRCFEATINDFAWNSSLSRSIGVDIRYALWLIDTVYGARQLVEEVTKP